MRRWAIGLLIGIVAAAIYLVPHYIPRYQWTSMVIEREKFPWMVEPTNVPVRVDRWTGDVQVGTVRADGTFMLVKDLYPPMTPEEKEMLRRKLGQSSGAMNPSR